MFGDLSNLAEIFEAIMLICFGVSWPVAIIKTLRTRRVEGKSFAFLVLIEIGYLAGITAKITLAVESGTFPAWVIWLYAMNAVLVLVDMYLVKKFRKGSDSDLSEPILP